MGKVTMGGKGDARGERTRMLCMGEYNCEIIILYRKKIFLIKLPSYCNALVSFCKKMGNAMIPNKKGLEIQSKS